ncbi:MAG TPA: radical SAM protein [candidate division Zixibacteria bacterium]|nr:radical SAM protein [candidate division Zixibacteria bacterium]
MSLEKQALYGPSKYLTVIREKSDISLIYHSLLGNARVVNRETVELLKKCEQDVTLEQLAKMVRKKDLKALFKLSYLHEKGFDERTYITQLLKERQAHLMSGELFTHLQLIMTNGCNFNCEYCFAYNFVEAINNRNNSGEFVAPKKQFSKLSMISNSGAKIASTTNGRNPRANMTPEIAEKAIDQGIAACLKHGRDRMSISFFGGEPTLNRKLICHILNRYGNGDGTGVRIAYDINTNGTKLDKELIEMLVRYKVRTEVSVDYICEETGGYRGARVPPVPWEIVRNNIITAVKSGVTLQLTSVLSSDTWKWWNHNLIDFAAYVGIGEIDAIVSFQFAFFKEYGPKNVAQKILEAYDYAQSKNVLLTGYWYHTYSLILDDEKREMQADYKTCPAIGRMISIEPNGSVYACKTSNRLIGNLDDWDGIFASPTYEYYAMRAYSNSPDCHGCELEGFCSGSSCGALEEVHDIYKMDAGYCEYIKTVVRGLLERHMDRLDGERHKVQYA